MRTSENEGEGYKMPNNSWQSILSKDKKKIIVWYNFGFNILQSSERVAIAIAIH
jgi:hypothetical protein